MDYDVLLVVGVVVGLVVMVLVLWRWSDARSRARVLEQRRLLLLEIAEHATSRLSVEPLSD